MTEPNETPQASARVVLVVEDEVLIRMAIADALRDAGYIVVEAANAAQAFEAVAAGLSPDVLFTDVRMPGEVDGIELAEQLKAALPRLKVFIASGHLSGTHARFAHNFVPKPYDPDNVVKRVMNAFED